MFNANASADDTGKREVGANLGCTQVGVALFHGSLAFFLEAVDYLGLVFVAMTETQEHKSISRVSVVLAYDWPKQIT